MEAQMHSGINLRTHREITSHQIADLMYVITHSAAWIYRTPIESDETARAMDTDGGAKMALESVLIRACDRLETLLTDGDRWTLPTVNFHDMSAAIMSQQVRGNEINLRVQSGQLESHLRSILEQIKSQPQPPAQNNTPNQGKKKHGGK